MFRRKVGQLSVKDLDYKTRLYDNFISSYFYKKIFKKKYIPIYYIKRSEFDLTKIKFSYLTTKALEIAGFIFDSRNRYSVARDRHIQQVPEKELTITDFKNAIKARKSIDRTKDESRQPDSFDPFGFSSIRN